MKRKLFTRLFTLLLPLALLLSTAAQALTLEQARDMLNTYYIDEVPAHVLEQATIAEMLEALGDPYTEYMSPEEYQQFNTAMSGQDLVGIGISAQVAEEGLLLQRVYEDTPAAGAGLLAGDLITAVDGRPTAGETIGTLTSWIQGRVGTQVTLTCLRDGETKNVTITRRAIVIPATYSELWDGRTGYIDCDSFGSETLDHFAQALERWDAENWIVDLRSNGGGLVSAAVRSANLFTGPGILAYLRDSSGGYDAYRAVQQAAVEGPVIVLVSQNTASAAELFAAAVRDAGAGLVIGSRTYGKGVAQSLFDQDTYPEYFMDGSAFKITTARFFSAIGSTDDTVGIIPHLLVNPNLAGEVAVLLSAPETAGEHMLRVDLAGSWYIDLEQALSEEYLPAFDALLEALPPEAGVFAGKAGAWAQTSAEGLAREYGLEDYQSRVFSDSGQSRFGVQIDTLATYGILNGRGDGTFQPAGELTRAQLCSLLAQALNCLYPKGDSRFSDVAMDSWYGPAVNALTEMGLVSGVGGGLFLPDEPVTHEQFITIMGRMAARLNMYLYEDALDMPEDALSAAVLAPYAEWARAGVWLLSMSQEDQTGRDINLLWDGLARIDPAGITTREEAAALTYSLLSYTGILPA